MRLFFLLTTLLLCVWAGAQTEPSNGTAAPASRSLFDSTSPQLTVDIRQDPLGPDLVTVTMLDPHYPADLLRKQMETFGQLLRSPMRGLTVFNYQMDPADKNSGFMKATCSVDGLMDAKSGQVLLTPIAQAFAGAPAPVTISSIAVVCEGLRPSAKTLQMYASPAQTVLLEGRQSAEGIEYRIQLRSQDPKDLIIREDGAPAAPAKSKSAGNGSDIVLNITLTLIVLAAGAFVYFFFMLRTGSSVKTKR